MKKKLWLSILMSMILLTLAACGGTNVESGSNEINTGANAESSTEANTEENSEPVEEEKSYTIAISQIVEHPSLDSTREGFLAALKDAGIVEGENLKVDYNNAQNDSTNNLSIAQKIASDDNDLVLGIATPSAVALVQQIKETPILFAAVTDPLAEKIVSNLENPGGNVSGASDTNPAAITQLMDFISEHFPETKNVGIVINEGETNAVIMADIAEEALSNHGITVIRAAVTNTSEVKQAVDSLEGRVDAIYITLDNMVVSAVDSIIKVANDNDIPFFSSDRDTVEAGAFATVGFKYYDHGYEVGEMAVEILKNGKNPAEMEITVPSKLDIIMNLNAASEQGIDVTKEMKNEVKDAENNIIE